MQSSDDCCPYCNDDPCGDYSEGADGVDGVDGANSLDNIIKGGPGISINSTHHLSSGCMYLGKSYANDQQIAIIKDPCANCKCKVSNQLLKSK